jgi:hypothetical protein
MLHIISHRGVAAVFAAVLISSLILVSCSQVREAAYRGVTSAVSEKVEQEAYRGVSSMLAGYSAPMLYQLAYTQAFLVGGYGVGMEDFEEGQGAVWRIEAGDENSSVSYTTERALLKKDDTSSWWYLMYQPDEEDAIEYEIKMNRSMEPLEMYMKNPESGEVDHHLFDMYDEETQDYRELEEDGFRTAYYNLDDWEEFKDGTEMIRVGSRNIQTTRLLHQGTEEGGDKDTEVRWWVTEDVPGHLVKYEMRDKKDGGHALGEMTDLRDGYTPKFASF